MRGVLDATITTAAKQRFESLLAQPRDFKPTLVFLKGRETSQPLEYWSYNVYAPHNIRGLTPGLWLLRRPLLYDCDGFVVAIPQSKLIGELGGKLLSVDGSSRLVVLERKHDG